jgi:hypothetical protein
MDNEGRCAIFFQNPPRPRAEAPWQLTLSKVGSRQQLTTPDVTHVTNADHPAIAMALILESISRTVYCFKR